LLFRREADLDLLYTRNPLDASAIRGILVLDGCTIFQGMFSGVNRAE